MMPQQKEILIVDDEVGIRELLSEILQDEGYQVSVAENAGEARSYRLRTQPALVLLDIWMPDTDGVTLLREWAANGQLTMPVKPSFVQDIQPILERASGYQWVNRFAAGGHCRRDERVGEVDGDAGAGALPSLSRHLDVLHRAVGSQVQRVLRAKAVRLVNLARQHARVPAENFNRNRVFSLLHDEFGSRGLLRRERVCGGDDHDQQ